MSRRWVNCQLAFMSTTITIETSYRACGQSRNYAYFKEKKEMHFYDLIYVLVGLCPNCARQDQIFPYISKRNQKLVEKVE